MFILKGVGKSAIIEAISLHAEKILRKSGDNPHNPRVLVCAPTGKAASIISEYLFHFDNKMLSNMLLLNRWHNPTQCLQLQIWQ